MLLNSPFMIADCLFRILSIYEYFCLAEDRRGGEGGGMLYQKSEKKERRTCSFEMSGKKTWKKEREGNSGMMNEIGSVSRSITASLPHPA